MDGSKPKKKKKFKPKIVARPRGKVKAEAKKASSQGGSNSRRDRRDRQQQRHDKRKPVVKTEPQAVENSSGSGSGSNTNVAEGGADKRPRMSAVETAAAALAAADAAAAAAASGSSSNTAAPTKKSSRSGANGNGDNASDEESLAGSQESEEFSRTTALPTEAEVPISLTAHASRAPGQQVESIGQWLTNEDNHGLHMTLQFPAELPLRAEVQALPPGKKMEKPETLVHEDITAFTDPRAVPNTLNFAASGGTSGQSKEALEVRARHGHNENLVASKLGKLRVHESGRVTMMIGGIEFDVESAIDTTFLQEAAEVTMETDEESRERYENAKNSPDGIEPGTHFYTDGTVRMLGAIEQRAVCTPSIESLLRQIDLDDETPGR